MKDDIPDGQGIIVSDFEKYNEADQEILKESWTNVKAFADSIRSLADDETRNTVNAEIVIDHISSIRFELKTISATITRNLDKHSAQDQVLLRRAIRNYGTVDADYDLRLSRSNSEDRRAVILEYIETASRLALKAYSLKTAFN